MNILILGPGAVGSLWATKFKLAGHNVSLWGRSSEELNTILTAQIVAKGIPDRKEPKRYIVAFGSLYKNYQNRPNEY